MQLVVDRVACIIGRERDSVSSASEVMTLWRYTNLFIIIIIIVFIPQIVKIPGVKNYKS